MNKEMNGQAYQAWLILDVWKKKSVDCQMDYTMALNEQASLFDGGKINVADLIDVKILPWEPKFWKIQECIQIIFPTIIVKRIKISILNRF